ncbi:MAG: hypothetical protein IJ374_04895 [Lachnospiraceae bacterium]|nr:hypothetical protein [Lachnospiraceae bacterium]
MKRKLWNMLAAAGSLAVLSSCQMVMRPYANLASGGQEYVVSGPKQCKRVLMELVSSTLPGERQECFLTGANYEPESLIIAQIFPDVVNISNTKIKDYQKDGHRYVTCRIGFERIAETEPSVDVDDEEGSPVGRHWEIGDVRSLKLGEETYRFRCVDDDYGDNSEYQRCALFLCETVIRSDVDSTDSEREILTFGRTNNYKTSQVRAWLKENVKDHEEEMVSVNTGVNSAYLGATVPGAFDQFSETGFLRYELPVQIAEDDLFLLSIEEAFEYRDELWEAEGADSSYSRGYWLRTPAYAVDSEGSFCYGTWGYAVDLELGCIRPVDISDGSIGIRPAFCLPQG